MSKIKTINLINLIVDALILVLVLAINVVLYFNKNGFVFASFMLTIVGVINLIFICIREGVVMTYDTKRYTIILHASHILLGVLLYYISKYVDGFYKVQILYWILLVVVIVVPIVVVYFMNKKDANKIKSNTPKFMVNK
jgi:FlaA1/EpsC-like NDP-sugar epimerase